MIVRTTVAVALALGLLAVSLPVVERARVDHSAAAIAGEIERLERSGSALAAANEVVPDDGTPARTRLTLWLPRRSWGDSGVDFVRFPAGTDGPDVIWRAGDGAVRRHTAPEFPLSGPPGGLVLGDGGRHRLVLELRDGDDGRRVVVRQSPGDRTSGE